MLNTLPDQKKLRENIGFVEKQIFAFSFEN